MTQTEREEILSWIEKLKRSQQERLQNIQKRQKELAHDSAVYLGDQAAIERLEMYLRNGTTSESGVYVIELH